MIVNKFLTFVGIHQDVEQATRRLCGIGAIQAFDAIRCGRTNMIIVVVIDVVCRGVVVIIIVVV